MTRQPTAWGAILGRAERTLENIAARDPQTGDSGNVEPMMSWERMEKEIRQRDSRLIELQAHGETIELRHQETMAAMNTERNAHIEEVARVHGERVRLQKAMIERLKPSLGGCSLNVTFAE